MFNIGLGLKLTNLSGGAAIKGTEPPSSTALLTNELSGFSLDFVTNDYSVKTVTDNELLLLLLGNEWSGLSIDFTTDLYANRIAVGAEKLLGTGPDTQEPRALALDFTDDSYATRI